jgi:Peptidase family M23
MVLYDQESLSQTRNLIFKPLGAILIAGGVLVGIALITSILIFSVPAINHNIPGFQTHLSEDYKSLQRKNMELEREVAEMDSMLKVFTQVMGAGNKPQPNGKMWESAMPEPANPDFQEPGQQAQTQPVRNDPPQPVQVEERPHSAEAVGAVPARKGPTILNLVPPIDGYVTKDFEPKDKPHFGIDLAAEENSLVRAVADGVVIFSEYSSTTGHVVGIWHSKSNLISFYKHNSRIFKTVGSYVFAGEAIAVIGNTGINSSGTHLHFELWYDNNPVNPADYINFN